MKKLADWSAGMKGEHGTLEYTHFDGAATHVASVI